jgi:hypothetical protein
MGFAGRFAGLFADDFSIGFAGFFPGFCADELARFPAASPFDFATVGFLEPADLA